MVLSVISTSEQRGLSAGVKRVIDHVKNPTEAVCSNAIRALCLDDKLEDAMQVLQSMGQEEKTKPRHRTYSPILACAGRLGDLDVARTVFVKMAEEYVNRPNEEDCAVLLQGKTSSTSSQSYLRINLIRILLLQRLLHRKMNPALCWHSTPL